MVSHMKVFGLSLYLALTIAWSWDNDSQPVAIYRSRPDLLAPILTPLEGIHHPDRMALGYFFLSPYSNVQPGIYIYDNNADLIYSSFGSYGAGPSHAPHVCWGHGHGVIMDKHYRFVRSVEPSCTYQATSDMHEFYLTDHGTRALMTQYTRSVYDLCRWGSCDGLGYIQSSGFQETGVEHGDCIFSWTSLDHIAPEHTLVAPSSTEISGSGESPDSPWDYFHINSVDKSDFDGGYLISARHMCAIYKIDGRTGRIVWQLGGKKNQYTYDDRHGNLDFAYQHDVRWISDSDDQSIISLFDNASNGHGQIAEHSTGKIIHLDHRAKIATLVETPLTSVYVDGRAHLSKSQGNFQLNLPGANRDTDVGGIQLNRRPGNRLLGYGNDPFFTEHAWTIDEKGHSHWEAVFYGALAWTNMMNYRVLKFDNWVGIPLTKPALWAYSKFGTNHTFENTNEMVLYVSWNGHTQIDTFMFYGSNDHNPGKGADSSNWQLLMAGWPKTGFETLYRHSTTYSFVFVEAFDKTSVSLGRSEVMTTFVPNRAIQDYCDDLACTFMDFENENRESMRQNMKEEYDTWLTSEDPEDSLAPVEATTENLVGQSRMDRIKNAGYLVSFVVLGLLLVTLMVLSLRRYNTVAWLNDKVAQILGMRTRFSEILRKGYYSRIEHPKLDIEDVDSQISASLASRATDNDLGLGKLESGLDGERHALWRAHSP